MLKNVISSNYFNKCLTSYVNSIWNYENRDPREGYILLYWGSLEKTNTWIEFTSGRATGHLFFKDSFLDTKISVRLSDDNSSSAETLVMLEKRIPDPRVRSAIDRFPDSQTSGMNFGHGVVHSGHLSCDTGNSGIEVGCAASSFCLFDHK